MQPADFSELGQEGCRPTRSGARYRCRGITPAVAATCARLLQIIQSKTQDTLVLKPVLDSSFVVAQTASNKQLDSLFALVSKTYGNVLLAPKPLEARNIYERGKNIGKLQLSEGNDVIMRLYHNIAMTYYAVNDYKTALIYFDSVKITRFDSVTQVFKITTLKNMAECYKNLNDKASAERIFIETEPLAQQYYSKTKLADFYIWYSSTLKTLKKFPESIEKAQKSLDIAELNLRNPSVTNADSILFALSHFLKIDFQRTVGDQFDIIESDHSERTLVKRRKPRRNIDDRLAKSFPNRAAPTRIKRPFDHRTHIRRRRRGEPERIR